MRVCVRVLTPDIFLNWKSPHAPRKHSSLLPVIGIPEPSEPSPTANTPYSKKASTKQRQSSLTGKACVRRRFPSALPREEKWHKRVVCSLA